MPLTAKRSEAPVEEPIIAAQESREHIDEDRLAEWFRLMSVPNRIELLCQLRSPKTLEEIRLKPTAAQAGDRPERPISRAAVQKHLEQLSQAELIRIRTTRRDGRRPAHEYVLDHARLFALVEEIRKIGTLRSQVVLDPMQTAGVATIPSAAWEPGPKLVLVHGVREGRVYPLRHVDLSGPRGWVIGRKATANVRLDYDPFVSSENSEIIRGAGMFRLVDLRSARNGTFLNWNRLPVGGEAPLRSGDIIGVGRSVLVFREN